MSVHISPRVIFDRPAALMRIQSTFVPAGTIRPSGLQDMLDSLDFTSLPPPVRLPDDEAATDAARAQSVVVFVGPSRDAKDAEEIARRGGFAAVRVDDAASAEVMLSRRPADVIVLDGGPIDFGACRRLASLRAGAVLVITGSEDEVDRVLALELGADDCVSPSCGDRELMARMRALAPRLAAPGQRVACPAVLRFSSGSAEARPASPRRKPRSAFALRTRAVAPVSQQPRPPAVARRYPRGLQGRPVAELPQRGGPDFPPSPPPSG